MGKELPVPKNASFKERRGIYKQRRLNARRNAEIKSAEIVLDEMNKFSSREMMQEVELAKAVCGEGVDGITDGRTLETIKNFALNNPHMGRKTSKLMRQCRKCAKKAKRYYKDGKMVPFDRSILAFADAMPENTAAEKRIRKSAIHKALKERSRYERAAMVYLDAYRLIKQWEDYQHYDEIAGKYSEARKRADEKKQKELEEVKRLEEMRRAELEALKKGNKGRKF